MKREDITRRGAGLLLLALAYLSGCHRDELPVAPTSHAEAATEALSLPPMWDAGPMTSMVDAALAKPRARTLPYGDFALASEPTPAHPKGTIGALSSGWADCPRAVVEVDLATLQALGHVCMPQLDRWAIAKAERGVVVASHIGPDVVVTWFDEARSIRATRTIHGFGVDEKNQLRGFGVVHDHAVVVDDHGRAYVLDEQSAAVAKHECRGDFGTGIAFVEGWGDRAVLTNIRPPTGLTQPMCAFGLNVSSPTLRVTWPAFAHAYIEKGELYDQQPTETAVITRKVGDDLRPMGPPVQLSHEGVASDGDWRAECDGITGSMATDWEHFHGLWIVRTESCCGDDEPEGLFVCDPTGGRR